MQSKTYRANDPELRSWVAVDPQSDFPIQNLPFGMFRHPDGSLRAASAIGDFIVDLKALQDLALFDGLELPADIFGRGYLNDFIALGKPVTNAVRDRLSDILNAEVDHGGASGKQDAFLVPADHVQMTMPIHIGDYTDFYSSREHATNVGAMFRDPANALLPNWLHLPVGYHGRASSIQLSGAPVRRPNGQTMPDGAETPVFGPSRLLDFELEMAFVVGKANALGDPVDIRDVEEHIFGLMLFNDWSARDIQRWEYVPLGPFLAKNFASTVSPWIVTLEALEPFRVAGPVQEPEVLPYLVTSGAHNFDIHLEVAIMPAEQAPFTVCRSNFRYMYWSMAQQLAHHTVGGCNMQVGDLCASGTISGPTPDSYGSMLELAWKGTRPIEMPDGSVRRFIQDGDTVCMRGYAERSGVRIGFGPCDAMVLPAPQK